MDPIEQKPKSKLIPTIIAVVVIALGAIGILALTKKTDTVATVPTDTNTGSPAPVTATTTGSVPPADTTGTTSKYKNGTYTAEGSYMSPGGPDKVKVTLTLQNDIVTDLVFTPEPGDHTSQRYQSMFASGINAVVVGKKIDSLNISKVSGSSLTSRGFNDALAKIEAQAQA